MNNMKKKEYRVIITGATGAIGLALIDECVKQNIHVLAVIRPDSDKRDRIPSNQLVEIEELRLDEYGDRLADLIKKHGDSSYDVFFHLAWDSTQGDAARAQLIPHAMNIKYSLDAVELAYKLGCHTFVGAGSQAEYGRTEGTLIEVTECHPETPYGIAKLCAGQLTRIACKQYGMKHIWPRILSAYGPNCQPQTIINYTITELLNNRVPQLTKCEQIWDFIYTGDVARALLLLAEKGRDGEVYVIGSGYSRPLKEFMVTLRDIVAPGVKLGIGEKPYSDRTVMHLSCDISKLKDDIEYEALTSFEEGIIQTRDWIKANLEG